MCFLCICLYVCLWSPAKAWDLVYPPGVMSRPYKGVPPLVVFSQQSATYQCPPQSPSQRPTPGFSQQNTLKAYNQEGWGNRKGGAKTESIDPFNSYCLTKSMLKWARFCRHLSLKTSWNLILVDLNCEKIIWFPSYELFLWPGSMLSIFQQAS